MAEAGEEHDSLGLIPDPPDRDSVGGQLSCSVPGSSRYGTIVVSPGVVISPGGKSFDHHRTASRREYRKMTHGKGRKVVHRNDGTLSAAGTSSVTSRGSLGGCDQEDPIRAHRVQPAYVDMVASSVPGAEVVRVPQAPERKSLTVDQTRSSLMDKINQNQILAAAERVAERDRERRERISRGEPVDLDESTCLLGESDENVQFLPFMRPDHVLPASFFSIVVPGFGLRAEQPNSGNDGKCSSFVTILSIWNTMMGTSLLSIPWAVGQSGLGGAIIIGIVMAAIACFTAIKIVEVHTALDSESEPIPEFAQLCGVLLGRKWELAAGIASLGAITGAVIVYWVLMSNFLFLTVNWGFEVATGTLPVANDTGLYCPKNRSVPMHQASFLDENQTLFALESVESEDFMANIVEGELTFYDAPPTDTYSRIWNRKTVPLYLLILFPIICMRSVTFFTKFNCLGSLSVGFILGLVVTWSFKWGFNANFSDPLDDSYVPLFKWSFPSLSGMLALGLFIHNAIITLCRNNRHPENNKRDVTISFGLVTATYLFVGIVVYLCFPLPKWCIEDNIYNNFQLSDKLLVAARALLLLQLVTVFPLLMYLIRVQLLILLRKPEVMVNIVIVNASICTICILFTVFMPNVGTIIRYSGALCGFCMIFTLPGMVKMAFLKRTDTLNWKHIFIYSSIIILGLANLIAQFLTK